MTDTTELEAKIAALAGRINLHKQQEQGHARGRGRGRGRGQDGGQRAPQRGMPYNYHRGRVAKFPYPTHRNRTLVLNGNPSAAPSDREAQPIDAPETNNWVTKNDRHMQLISTAVFDHMSRERAQSMAKTIEQKQIEKDRREKAQLSNHFEGSYNPPCHETGRDALPNGNTKAREININSISFQVTDGGSKLLRLSRDPTLSTPKRIKIAGVMFLRSKNGNLYRAGLVKAKKRREVTKVDELCPRFTVTGTCSEGPNCRFLHDCNKLAICKDFLSKGDCPLGNGCDLSHTPTPHRVPACVHFIRGNCTNANCRYAHIRINPTAPVCRAFARLGYCSKGPDCPDRHMFECPDYANKGMCRKPKCRLPHVDHAGQLRGKAASAETSMDSEEEDYQDISSDEEIYGDSDDVDSDGLEDDTGIGQGLSQQQDYVRL